MSGAADMMARDAASALLGMVVERAEPGDAVVSMRVREDMLNGFAITHGGFVFTLADTARARRDVDVDAATATTLLMLGAKPARVQALLRAGA